MDLNNIDWSDASEAEWDAWIASVTSAACEAEYSRQLARNILNSARSLDASEA